MIKEELYIIKDGEKYNLDLPTPSGITLKWVSNLFSEISKLTCSYSYTFKLPMTANNRRVLDIADDIRYSSSFARISVDAEFYINGVCLCPNANLHVSEIGASSFSCVMTWRVLKAFEKMKNDSIKLNELPSVGTFVWKTGDDSLVYGFPTHAHTNMEDVLYPNYDAGIAYEEGTPPKPVVPVYRLVQLINDYYGVKFVLGRELTGGMGLLPKVNFNNKRHYGKNVYDDYLTYGVLPITGIGVSSGTQNKFTIANVEGKPIYYNTIDVGSKEYRASWESWVVTSTNQGTKDSIRSVVYEKDNDLSNWHRYADIMGISFDGNKYIQSTVCEISSETTSVNEETSKHLYGKGGGQTSGGVHLWTHWEIYACTGVLKDSFTLQKVVKGGNYKSRYLFRCLIDSELRGEAEVRVSKEDIKAKKAEAKDYWWIYLLQVKQGENDEDASVDVYSEESEDWMGLRSISREETDTEYIYKFDFGVKYDVRKLSIDAADDDEVGLCFWSGSYEEGWATKDADNKVTGTGTKYTNTATFSYLRVASITPIVQFDGLPAEMGIIENLPDISCFDFLKNLFYLNGALPRVEKDGVTITAMYYNQLRDRVVNGDSLDWSKKLLSGVNKNPTSAKTYNSNFGRENYFLMATSEKDKTDEEKLEEVELYGKGYGQIDIDDKRLDEEKNAFTSCFYPGLRQDLAYPNLLTGRTVKVWNGEKQVQSDVNPIYGFVNYRALNSIYEDVSNAFSRPMLKTYGADFKHIRMDAFEPFDNMDEFYGYLKSILTDYVIIKEKFNLNEFDLMNFDESVPVYLQKYNCCFAVSTIQRDKNGISTVELVKLPYVVPNYADPEGTDIDKVSYQYVLKSSVIGFELSLIRDYTSNRCPICYEYFVNNQHKVWSTTYNILNIPNVQGDGNGPAAYISRYVFPYEIDRLKGDSYTLEFTVPKVVRYAISKNIGIDTEYTKELTVAIRVYYDDVKCEVGTHKLVFTRNDFGTHHVFKFFYDIYNVEGKLVEKVRKKLYYFVSKLNESVISDDFGDTHEEDDKPFVPYVEIGSGSVYADGMFDLKVGGKNVRIMQESNGETKITSYSGTFSLFWSEKVAPYSHDASLWDTDSYHLFVNVRNNVKLIKHDTPISTVDEECSFEYHFYLDGEEVETAYNDPINKVSIATFSKENIADTHTLRFVYSIRDSSGNVIKSEDLTQTFCVLGFAEKKECLTTELLFGFAIDLKMPAYGLANTRYKKNGAMYVNDSVNLGEGRKLIIEDGVTDVGPNLVNGSWETNSYGVFSVDQSGTGALQVKTTGKVTKGELVLETWEKTSLARVYWDGKQVGVLSEVMTKNGYTDETHSLKIEYDVVDKKGTVTETKTLNVTYHSTCYFS